MLTRTVVCPEYIRLTSVDHIGMEICRWHAAASALPLVSLLVCPVDGWGRGESKPKLMPAFGYKLEFFSWDLLFVLIRGMPPIMWQHPYNLSNTWLLSHRHTHKHMLAYIHLYFAQTHTFHTEEGTRVSPLSFWQQKSCLCGWTTQA